MSLSTGLFCCLIIVVVSVQFSLQQRGGWLQSQHGFKGKTNQEESGRGRKCGVVVKLQVTVRVRVSGVRARVCNSSSLASQTVTMTDKTKGDDSPWMSQNWLSWIRCVCVCACMCVCVCIAPGKVLKLAMSFVAALIRLFAVAAPVNVQLNWSENSAADTLPGKPLSAASTGT